MQPSAVGLAVESPLRFAALVYSFVVQLILIALHRILLPTYPQYQSLRTQVQRAYLLAATLNFPEFPNRLPAEYPSTDAYPVHGEGWKGYLIPGKDGIVAKLAEDATSVVVLFAHGGGYARGVARMYVPYQKRWSACAKAAGFKLVFLSVEYPLSTEAPHPAQRTAFLAAYQHLLQAGISPKRIIFMGDSAGGGLSINSATHAKQIHLPQPACSILISPWIDMEMTAFQSGSHAVTSDYFVQANEAVPALTKLFLGNASPSDPDANALCRSKADLQGLNPQLIFVGGAEFALSDSKEWAKRCREAGIQHDIHIEWGQLHVWALGSKFIKPALRTKTDARMMQWIRRWTGEDHD